jgi:hypothetical protein
MEEQRMREIKIIHGDGVTDDTEALQHYVNGGKVIYPDGSSFPKKSTHIVNKTIEVGSFKGQGFDY